MRWHHETEQPDRILRSQIHWAQHSGQLERSWQLHSNIAFMEKPELSIV